MLPANLIESFSSPTSLLDGWWLFKVVSVNTAEQIFLETNGIKRRDHLDLFMDTISLLDRDHTTYAIAILHSRMSQSWAFRLLADRRPWLWKEGGIETRRKETIKTDTASKSSRVNLDVRQPWCAHCLMPRLEIIALRYWTYSLTSIHW